MASSKESYKQDLVISIRYKNDLPPPPMPPKLLEIDTGGLQQYLDPGFAASIAKREEPNIEADAEGGMPIDVIGMYGYFDGDEASIMAPDVPMPLDPEDEILMLAPEQLKAGGPATGSNFLRKTQYMTATSAVTNDASRTQQPRRPNVKPKAVPLHRDDKENVKNSISKAFDLAYPASKKTDAIYDPSTRAEINAWSRPVHPSNRNLKPVNFLPVLPDFEAATVIGPSWNLLRFDKPPLPAIKGHRDNRLDAAFLMASEHPEKKKTWEDQKAAFDADPTKFEDPGNPPVVWSLLLPRDQAATPLMRKLTNSRDPEHAEQGLIARVADPDENDGNRLKVPLDRVRYYSNAVSQDKEAGRHTRQVVLTLPKQGSTSSSKAARYYPIGQANKLMSDRTTAKSGKDWRTDFEAELPDQVMVDVRDPNNEELANRYYTREEYDPTYASQFAEILAAAKVDQRVDQEDEQDHHEALEQHAADLPEPTTNGASHARPDVEMAEADLQPIVEDNDDD